MNRLQKKCFVASTGLHLFLFFLVIFGSAFFIPRDKTVSLSPLKVVPTRLVDAALSGGGGDPKIAPSDAQQKGETLVPQPPAPVPEPRPVQPPVRPVAAQKEPKKVVDKVKPVKPKDVVKEPVKPVVEPKKVAKVDEIILKPVTRNNIDRAKEKAEAEAKQKAESERKAALAASRRAAKEVERATVELSNLRTGFSKGTAIQVDGPGGEAYANYDQLVKQHYDDAWVTSPDLADDNSIVVVRVTISRSGRVVNAEIKEKSGNSALDRSVRRALDKVKYIAPFPEGAREEERTYTIEFNLKTKRLLG